MALLLQHKTDALHWAVWQLDESLEALLSLLPDVRRTAYERELSHFVSVRRRLEWLAVRVLLHIVAGQDTEIVYSPEGKPRLADSSSSISISHTQGYVAIALSRRCAVGIDIEHYAPRVHKVADRFIRPDESPSPFQGDSTWGLLLHWSAKETLYKRLDSADADFRHYRITPFISQEEGRFSISVFTASSPVRHTIAYRIFPDFVLTWTTD